MKREHGLIFAGAIGIAAIAGFLAVRKFLNKKDYRKNFYQLFELQQCENQHGIELFSMQ